MSEDITASKLKISEAQRRVDEVRGISNEYEVVKELGVNEYFSLTEGQKQIVDEWLEKYSLLNMERMATKILKIKNHPDWVVEVHGLRLVYMYYTPDGNNPYPIHHDRNGEQIETLIATFAFDDFPWEVLA